jgi:cytochrome c biogenesis protein CcdA/thiol-disulfide isomerase/thioredoxin
LFELIVIGFVAGIVAGISPCILPVLPVVLVAGATTPGPTRRTRRTWGRPVTVVAGLVVSFSVLILVGSEVLSLLHLPQDLLRDAGIALLVLLGAGLLVPPLGLLLERPFAAFAPRHPSGKTGGFVLGLGLGALFVPCAGPILAAITVVGALHRVGWAAVLLTCAFAVGAAVPLLIVGLAGSQLVRRVRSLREEAPLIRQLSGVVLIVMALTIGFNVFSGLQRDVPGYTSALQSHLEGSTTIRKQLNSLTGAVDSANATLADCDTEATALVECGAAPLFKGITAWLNTPGGGPLTLAGLRGKVVLIDFWTYSCINCQRALPHVEAWYQKYRKDGLQVVGVHTPEFSFEHVVANVTAEAVQLGVRYPVAIDNAYATWNNYDNESWPAEYLIDAKGVVRHVHFGEGDYSQTESLIRQLLVAAHPGIALPSPSEVVDETPSGELSPETYLGYQRLEYLLPTTGIPREVPSVFHFPSSLPLGGLGLEGTWTDNAQEATAGADAKLELGFVAHDVYLVLGGSGTVQVSVNGTPVDTAHVAGIPKLYTLFRSGVLSSGTLMLQVSPGVQAYDFTFG